MWLVPAVLAMIYGMYQIARTFWATQNYVLATLVGLVGIYMCLFCYALLSGAMLVGTPLALALYFTLNYLYGIWMLHMGLEAREDRLGVESRLKARMDAIGHGAVRTVKRVASAGFKGKDKPEVSQPSRRRTVNWRGQKHAVPV